MKKKEACLVREVRGKKDSDMKTIIAVILFAAVVAVEAWFVYRMFRNKGPNVGPFRFIRAVAERKDASMKYDLIKIKVGLPASTAGDVARRELTIRRAETADGELKAEEVFSTSMAELEFEAVQDSIVDLSCVAFDDAEPPNKSEPKEISFEVEDTVAPDQSGDFTIETIGERTVGAGPASSEEESADEATAESETETGASPAETPPGESNGPPAHVPPPATEADADAKADAEAEAEASEDKPPTSGSDVTNS